MPYTLEGPLHTRRHKRALSNASTGSYTPLQEDSLTDALVSIWEELCEHPSSAYFLHRIPDYYLEYQPYFDLKIIRNNIDNGLYQEATLFLSHLATMISTMRKAADKQHHDAAYNATFSFVLAANVVLQKYSIPSASMFNSMVDHEGQFGPFGATRRKRALSRGDSRHNKQRLLNSKATVRQSTGPLNAGSNAMIGYNAHALGHKSGVQMASNVYRARSLSTSSTGSVGSVGRDTIPFGNLPPSMQQNSSHSINQFSSAPSMHTEAEKLGSGSSASSISSASSSSHSHPPQSQKDIIISGEMARLKELKMRVSKQRDEELLEEEDSILFYDDDDMINYQSMPLESLPFTYEFGDWAETDMFFDDSDSLSDSYDGLVALNAEFDRNPHLETFQPNQGYLTEQRVRRNVKLNRALANIPEEYIVELLEVLSNCEGCTVSPQGELLYDLNNFDDASIQRLSQFVSYVKNQIATGAKPQSMEHKSISNTKTSSTKKSAKKEKKSAAKPKKTKAKTTKASKAKSSTKKTATKKASKKTAAKKNPKTKRAPRSPKKSASASKQTAAKDRSQSMDTESPAPSPIINTVAASTPTTTTSDYQPPLVMTTSAEAQALWLQKEREKELLFANQEIVNLEGTEGVDDEDEEIEIS